jgi:nitronate monooxygenase
MFLVSGPELIIAACRSGIMGAFPTNNARTVEELDAWMLQIATALESTDRGGRITGPWVANLVTHSSNARMAADLDMISRYRPPIVVTALGSPRPAVDVVHRYGGMIIADVVNLRLARKALDAGADGLACIATGAGGHTGDISAFAFISAIRDLFDGIVIVGGGIADGWGIAGAIAAGADCAYVGTRFIATPESIAPDYHKQLVIDASVADLTVSGCFTGAPASWLRQSIADVGMDPDNLPPDPGSYFSSNERRPKRWKDVLSAGQGVGAVHALERVDTIVDRLEDEYRQACDRFQAVFGMNHAPARGHGLRVTM